MAATAFPLALAHPLSPAKAPRETPFFEPDPGTLVELSGQGATARTTLAVSLVIRAQASGETTLWIMHDAAGVYAPDLAASGADLAALVVVRVARREGAKAIVRAAEIALRSGGFGLAVLDLVDGAPS